MGKETEIPITTFADFYSLFLEEQKKYVMGRIWIVVTNDTKEIIAWTNTLDQLADIMKCKESTLSNLKKVPNKKWTVLSFSSEQDAKKQFPNLFQTSQDNTARFREVFLEIWIDQNKITQIIQFDQLERLLKYKNWKVDTFRKSSTTILVDQENGKAFSKKALLSQKKINGKIYIRTRFDLVGKYLSDKYRIVVGD